MVDLKNRRTAVTSSPAPGVRWRTGAGLACVAFGILLLLSTVAAPCASARTSEAGVSTQHYFWCWAAPVNPSIKKMFYSGVFESSLSADQNQVAFAKFVQDQYPDANTGPGECSGYSFRSAAKGAMKQNVENFSDEDQIIATEWTPQGNVTQTENAKPGEHFVWCWAAPVDPSIHKMFYSAVFQTALSTDQVGASFAKHVQDRHPDSNTGPGECSGYPRRSDAEAAMKLSEENSSGFDKDQVIATEWAPQASATPGEVAPGGGNPAGLSGTAWECSVGSYTPQDFSFYGDGRWIGAVRPVEPGADYWRSAEQGRFMGEIDRWKQDGLSVTWVSKSWSVGPTGQRYITGDRRYIGQLAGQAITGEVRDYLHGDEMWPDGSRTPRDKALGAFRCSLLKRFGGATEASSNVQVDRVPPKDHTSGTAVGANANLKPRISQ